MEKKYELLVLATENKIDLLRTAIPYYLRNLNPKMIYIIADMKLSKKVEGLKGVSFIDEDMVLHGMSKSVIEDMIERISGKRSRAGWYFQQFIKLAWSERCTDRYYVVIDSDTIPLNPIRFIDEDGRYLLTKKVEYHKAYFDAIGKLFNGKVSRPGEYSFIAENMVFDCEAVREMLTAITSNTELSGDSFFEKILYAIRPDDIQGSGFSEFETYGCFMARYHGDLFRLRDLRTSREAVYVLGSHPSEEQLEWASKDYDLISIELSDYGRTMLTALTSKLVIRKLFAMKTLTDMRKKLRSFYRRLLGKQDYIFD